MLDSAKDFLTRAEAAAALTAAGLPMSRATLAGMAAGRGGAGPTYRRFGRRALYAPNDLRLWAEARLSAPSTGARS